MAYIRSYRNGYRAEIDRPGLGIRESKMFEKRGEAIALARRREAQIDAGKKGIILPHSMKEALGKYSKEVSPTKRGEKWEQVRLKLFERTMDFAGRPAGRSRPSSRPTSRSGATPRSRR